MKIITTDRAPSAIGPYSQAIQTGSLLYMSGQLGINPATGKLAGDTTVEQATQAINNVKNLLESQGYSLNHVVKSTLFLANLDDFKDINTIYANAFGEHKPARSTFEVSRLPMGAKFEIECIAEIN